MPLIAALAVSAGCAFVPPADDLAAPAVVVAVPVEPSRTAPRLAPLETRHFEVQVEHELVGEPQVVFSRDEDTFVSIARSYNVGYEELRFANPGVDQWLPGEETPIYLPTASILPEAPHAGIVINVAALRIFYFTGAADEPKSITTHPIGIGQEEWATPLGEATVTQKARDPIWYVPASVRKEHAEKGDPLPAMVPPGPDNPLGRFAMALSLPGYLIHGTNKPAGVGMRSSHGCIRLFPEDIEALYERVKTGTPVRIVNQPVLAGWRDGQLYLEVHPFLVEDERDPAAEAARVLEAALARAGVPKDALDPVLVSKIVAEQRGIPFPVLLAAHPPERYLATARIVENIAPSREREQTAALASAPERE